MQFRIVVTLLTLFLFSVNSYAQLYENLKEEIEKIVYYDTEITPKKNPGYIIGVILGDTSFTFSYGSLTKDSIQPPHAYSLFEIGDVTKVFTATLLKVLENEHLMHPDSSLNVYLPPPLRSPDCQAITIGHLQTHYSGLPKMPLEFGSREKETNNPYANYTKQDLHNFYLHHSCSTPGREYLYSNLGYALLELAIENATGLPFEEALREKVLIPLGLVNTQLVLTQVARNNLAQGYAIGGKPTAPWEFSSFAASEGLKSSLSDLLRFVHANIGLPDGREWNEILQPMHLPLHPTKMTRYSFIASGWHVIKNKKYYDLVVHSGSTSGAQAFVGFVKENRTGVVILSNSEYGMGGLGFLIMRMLNNNWRKKR